MLDGRDSPHHSVMEERLDAAFSFKSPFVNHQHPDRHTHTHTHTHTRKHVNRHTDTFTNTQEHTHRHTNAQSHTRDTNTCTYIQEHKEPTFLQACMSSGTHIGEETQAYSTTHTRTHTRTHTSTANKIQTDGACIQTNIGAWYSISQASRVEVKSSGGIHREINT